MKRLVAAAALVFAALTAGALPALADSLISSRNPSTVGHAVTFTASFTPYCADGANGGFTVDGRAVTSTSFHATQTGGTATLTTSSLSVGTHTIVFSWTAGVAPYPTCGGKATLLQRVIAASSPKPPPPKSPPARSPSPAGATPSLSPGPTAGPSVPASPSPTSTAASPARVNLAAGSAPLATPVALGLGAALVIALGGMLAVRRLTKSRP